MFKRKNRAASAAPVPDNVTVLDGPIMPAKRPGHMKCALLALRDWIIYYAIMYVFVIALGPFFGSLVNLALPVLVQTPLAYLIGKRLMKTRPEGTVHKIPRRRKWLLALAYAAVIAPVKTAIHGLYLSSIDDYGAGPLGYMLVLLVIAPVSEELLYRGVLFPLAERRSGFWPAAIMNAVVFALVHFPNVGNMVTSLTTSIVACALQSMTGRTRYGIMIHWVFNTLNIPLAAANPTLPPVAGIAAIAVTGTALVLFCVKREAVAQKLIPGWK